MNTEENKVNGKNYKYQYVPTDKKKAEGRPRKVYAKDSLTFNLTATVKDKELVLENVNYKSVLTEVRSFYHNLESKDKITINLRNNQTDVLTYLKDAKYGFFVKAFANYHDSLNTNEKTGANDMSVKHKSSRRTFDPTKDNFHGLAN